MSRAASVAAAAAVARFAPFLPLRASLLPCTRGLRTAAAASLVPRSPPGILHDVRRDSPPPQTPDDEFLRLSTFWTIYSRPVCPVGSMSLDLLRRVLMRDSCSRRLLLPGDEVRKCHLGTAARDKLFRITGTTKRLSGIWTR